MANIVNYKATIRQSFSRNSNEMVKEPFRKVMKTTNLAKIYQNRRNKLNKIIIRYLFGGNDKNSKDR